MDGINLVSIFKTLPLFGLCLLDEVYQAVPGLRYSLKLENALNTTCEIHPGAMKYYKEIGLVK